MSDQLQKRLRLSIRGIVQGVGFRPYVYRLANELGLVGWVGNDTNGVTIEVQGEGERVDVFRRRLAEEAPPLARIDGIGHRRVELLSETGFTIVASRMEGRANVPVGPDVATCPPCLDEVFDSDDRRSGYPFTNCTNCGPRYSIITGVPYDRANTTMAGFKLCVDCQGEYDDPGDRRFHAQPLCCPRCGPRLDVSIDDAAAALADGQIVAMKGLGGYHLTVRAADNTAVARLRSRKTREDKPFAVMVADLAAARRLCHLGDAEEILLASTARPIVLAARRATPSGPPVADAVAPGATELGIMLPYTPLHSMVLDRLGEPMVCTSGNLSDEPIAYRDDDAHRRLQPIADIVLTHNRPIHIRIDDSVTRVVDGRPYPIRRSRGYAPAPLPVSQPAPRAILACGAELKNTIAYARGQEVFVSHHIGDLKTYETHQSFLEAVEHLARLLDIRPEVVAHDLHPDYLSTAYATEQVELEPVGVQHHHAHVAACLADADHRGPVIGVAFDGMGYGDDGTIWGGEFLIADLATYSRAAWFEPVPMPGGDAATTEPWRMAAAYLQRIGSEWRRHPAVAQRNDDWEAVTALARSGFNSPLTSSVGRLFDAVASLLDVRDRINYEGQAAIELERLADPSVDGEYRASVRSRDGTHVVVGTELVAAVMEDLDSAVTPSSIAMRFHRGVAASIVDVCRRIRQDHGLATVALSGGVFLNRLLVVDAMERLKGDGFEVLRHQRVPCNDGGISFGQAAVAAARDR